MSSTVDVQTESAGSEGRSGTNTISSPQASTSPTFLLVSSTTILLIVLVGLAWGFGWGPLSDLPGSGLLAGINATSEAETAFSTDSESTSDTGFASSTTGDDFVEVLQIPEAKWRAMALRIERAEIRTIREPIPVNGEIRAVPSRRVMVRSRVDGIVREVLAYPGQEVASGTPLIVLDSPTVGQTRLTLRAHQRALILARIDLEWRGEIALGVERVLGAFDNDSDLNALQRVLAHSILGSSRGELISAFSRYEQARLEEERQSSLAVDRIVGQTRATEASRARLGAESRFRAILEQISHDVLHERLTAEQALRMAEADMLDAWYRLRLLGIDEPEPKAIRPANADDDPTVDVDAADGSHAEMSFADHISSHKIEFEANPLTMEDLTRCSLSSPFDGAVLSVSTAPSQQVDRGEDLIEVVDASRVWIVAEVPESRLAETPRIGETIHFTAETYDSRQFEARVVSVSPQVDPETRTVEVIGESANSEDLFRIGMYVRVKLPGPATDPLLTVSEEAVFRVDGRDVVFVPDPKAERTYRMHMVQCGESLDGRREIYSGLVEGDLIVVGGAFQLKSELILLNEPEEE